MSFIPSTISNKDSKLISSLSSPRTCSYNLLSRCIGGTRGGLDVGLDAVRFEVVSGGLDGVCFVFEVFFEFLLKLILTENHFLPLHLHQTTSADL